MALTPHLTLVICVVCLLFVRVPGLALRKRNVENKLHEALKVIERQKRHVVFDEAGQDWPDTRWDAVYPDISERGYEEGYDIPSLQDLYASQYLKQLDTEPTKTEKFHWNDLFDQDADPEVPPSSLHPVSQEELQTIFGSSENEEKEDEEDGPSEDKDEKVDDKREYDPSQKNDKRSPETGLSEGEVDALLADADSTLDGALKESSRDAPAVSDAELRDIFGDVASEEGTAEEDVDSNDVEVSDNKDSNEDTGEDLPQDINKEWLINQYIEAQTAPQTSTKRKRSYWNTYPTRAGRDTPYEEAPEKSQSDLSNDLAAAKADIKILKNFLALEDEENANLAKALNLATKSQTERSDKYVQDEIQYIKEAIQDEVDLQEIRDVLQIAKSLKDSPEDMDDVTEDDLDLSPPGVMKRTSPDVDEESRPVEDENEDADERVALEMPEGEAEETARDMPEDLLLGEEEAPETDEVDSLTEDEDMSNEELVNMLLARKLKDIFKESENNDISSVYRNPSGLERWYKNPSIPSADNSDQGKDFYLNPLMRELWQKLRKERVSKRAEEYERDSEDLCQAVQTLTNGCSFMSDLGLGLDDEATELCDRHQLCYFCGAALDLTPNDCDRGYLSEAAMLCDKEGGCDEDAAGLFIIMLKYHSFQPLGRVPDECADTCAADFIAGRLS